MNNFMAKATGEIFDRYGDSPDSLSLLTNAELVTLNSGIEQSGGEVTVTFQRAARGDKNVVTQHLLDAAALDVREIQHRARIALDQAFNGKVPSFSQMAALLVILGSFKHAIDQEIARRDAGRGGLN